MRRTVLVYGSIGGVFIAVLELIKVRYLVVDHAVEIYGALVALLFSALGIWLGLRLTRPAGVGTGSGDGFEGRVREPVPEVRPPNPSPKSVPDPASLQRFGITPREHEILQLIASGLSNREIAERLSVSEHTVKTHTSRLLDKLHARRRTHAVQLAKDAGLIA